MGAVEEVIYGGLAAVCVVRNSYRSGFVGNEVGRNLLGSLRESRHELNYAVTPLRDLSRVPGCLSKRTSVTSCHIEPSMEQIAGMVLG
jgi:hypothetical protein